MYNIIMVYRSEGLSGLLKEIIETFNNEAPSDYKPKDNELSGMTMSEIRQTMLMIAERRALGKNKGVLVNELEDTDPEAIRRWNVVLDLDVIPKECLSEVRQVRKDRTRICAHIKALQRTIDLMKTAASQDKIKKAVALVDKYIVKEKQELEKQLKERYFL